MKKQKIFIIIFAVITVLLVAVFKLYTSEQDSQQNSQNELFLSFDCELCLESYNHINNQQIEFTTYFYPKNSIQYETYVALKAAGYQNLFEQFLNEIYTNSINNTDDLNNIAEKLKMDMQKFDIDINSSKISTEIQNEIKYIDQRGITHFPTLIFSNRIITINSKNDLNLIN